MKAKFIFFFLLTFAMSCSANDKESVGDKKAIRKVMSFNIRYSNTIDQDELSWEARKEPCARMIQEIAPDIIGVQEPRSNQLEDLATLLPEYAQIHVVQEDISAAQTGYTTVLYRQSQFSLLDSGYFWLSETPDQPTYPWEATDKQYRVAVWTHLQDKTTQKDLFFVATHYPYKTETADNEARLKCTQLIIEKMKLIAGRHVPIFVTGDLNASYAANDTRRNCLVPFYEWMWAARESAPDADLEYSFNGFGESEPKNTWNIDHIFYRLVTPLQFRTIVSPDYGVQYISDHYPITLTFEY